MANAGCVLSAVAPSIKELAEAEDEIRESMRNYSDIWEIFSGPRIDLDESEFRQIEIKFENDRRIREIINTMHHADESGKVDDAELRLFLKRYPALNITHYDSLYTADWLSTMIYLKGKEKHGQPTDEEIAAYEEKLRLEFDVFYVLSYYQDRELIEIPDKSLGKTLEMLLQRKGKPLEKGALKLLEERRNRDIIIVSRINGMLISDENDKDKTNQFDRTDKYRAKRENGDHYSNLQGVDWLKPALYLEGENERHEPGFMEISKIVKKEGPRFRAYYVFAYPHLVEKVGK